MQYVHVKSLEKYHPGYKDRELKWFKCYFKMVNADPEFEMLCEIDKWRFVALIMLELQYQKPIPIDNAYLTRKGFDLKKRSISLSVQMLQNLIEVVTGEEKPCDDSVTKRREEKSKIREEKSFVPPTLLELETYVREKNYNLDCNKFFEFFDASGWVDSKGNKVRNWKQKVITWSSRNGGQNGRAEKTIGNPKEFIR